MMKSSHGLHLLHRKLLKLTLWPRHCLVRRMRHETCYQIALAIKDEVEDLEKAGINVIQIDEVALREGLPLRKSEHVSYLKWAVHSFRITNVGVQDPDFPIAQEFTLMSKSKQGRKWLMLFMQRVHSSSVSWSSLAYKLTIHSI
ncbi:uncharacterized protein LOC110693668 [Chenopodium quinoa]|uniref:uncharacterized protein LOC110693668 n=1 Tax=Chenopodium quinoa TaxID=63459 RepID=UPI000B770CA4|nr:uncharacterized protein LOC110693668 [Chenopodium quinoa]XP_021726518.1 uncharacterized protein LOC110693668 [Chenopodium quinoa]XP_021726519.1 uncharacterized protein LOC110693668 [Chenopodium quinoa]